MEKDNVAKSPAGTPSKVPLPVILDLGRKSRKAVKKLRNGEGKLMFDVERAIEQTRSRLPDDDKGKQVIPIVIIVCRKKKRRRSFSCSPLSPLNLLR